MYNSETKEKVYRYLHRIYGSYVNLIAAGSLFIAYAILVVFDLFFVGRAFRLSALMFRFPGLILLVMGCFFTYNAFRLRKDGHFENKILLARGIFDLLSGLLILIMPRFGMMMTMLVMGLVLIHIGVDNLVKPNATLLQLILSVILIPIGLSDIDVINYLFFYQLRILIFALSLGALGIFLVLTASGYKAFYEPVKVLAQPEEKDVQVDLQKQEPEIKEFEQTEPVNEEIIEEIVLTEQPDTASEVKPDNPEENQETPVE